MRRRRSSGESPPLPAEALHCWAPRLCAAAAALLLAPGPGVQLLGVSIPALDVVGLGMVAAAGVSIAVLGSGFSIPDLFLIIASFNVLVALYDDKPVPKVIDFGVAKATNQQLTEKTLFTRYAQIIGTPAYMSPEQA